MSESKRVLILGATGLLGTHIMKVLIHKGHYVICAARNPYKIKEQYPNVDILVCDYTKDIDVNEWVQKLKNIDVIINCVGIFYHPNTKIIWAVHYETPKIVYEAAQKAGVEKIIHISALGIEHSHTEYAKSKLQAEKMVQSLDIPFFILKPSFIYGESFQGGMLLLRSLSALPFFIPLPGKGQQEFQPIYVGDLAQAVGNLVSLPPSNSYSLAAVSEQKMTLKEILEDLRQGLGLKKGYFLHIPIAIIKMFATLGNFFPSVMNKDAILMLEAGSSTTMEKARLFQKVTSITPIPFMQGIKNILSSQAQRWHAKLTLFKAPLRLSLAFMWLFSAITSYFFYSHKVSMGWLTIVGISSSLQPLFLYGACTINALIGLGLLVHYKTKINCLVQLLVITLYTVLISWKLPYLWWEPFGPIVKNIPILVSILILYVLESE